MQLLVLALHMDVRWLSTLHSQALPGRLDLYAADLLQEGSFDSVCKGADVVFHTASPYIRGAVDDPQGTLVDPAVKASTLHAFNVKAVCSVAQQGGRLALTCELGHCLALVTAYLWC